jgi:hypothetical protein
VLWAPDGQPTPKYNTYLKNQMAYGMQIAAFTIAQNKALADPAQADSWPMLAAPLQMGVDQAYDKWKSQGADEIEGAIAAVESLGVPLEQGMIMEARKTLEAWSVNIGGVAAKTPYTFVLPSEWASIDVDDIGWTRLQKDSSSYQSHYNSNGYNLSTGQWRGDSSQSSGSGGIHVFGFGFSGSHSESSSSNSSGYSQTSTDGSSFQDDATELDIDMEYGLVEIVRPWLSTDLFHMQNWYLRDGKAKSISDGTIAGQVGKTDPLLPLIPTHFLCIRNVRIHTSNWGSTRTTLENHWGKQQSSDSSNSSSTSGSVDIPVCGFINLSAGMSHSDSHYEGQFSDEAGHSYSNDNGAHFDGETLEIKGAQIVAWLSEVVPASPPMDQPPADAVVTPPPAAAAGAQAAGAPAP